MTRLQTQDRLFGAGPDSVRLQTGVGANRIAPANTAQRGQTEAYLLSLRNVAGALSSVAGTVNTAVNVGFQNRRQRKADEEDSLFQDLNAELIDLQGRLSRTEDPDEVGRLNDRVNDLRERTDAYVESGDLDKGKRNRIFSGAEQLLTGVDQFNRSRAEKMEQEAKQVLRQQFNEDLTEAALSLSNPEFLSVLADTPTPELVETVTQALADQLPDGVAPLLQEGGGRDAALRVADSLIRQAQDQRQRQQRQAELELQARATEASRIAVVNGQLSPEVYVQQRVRNGDTPVDANKDLAKQLKAALSASPGDPFSNARANRLVEQKDFWRSYFADYPESLPVFEEGLVARAANEGQRATTLVQRAASTARDAANRRTIADDQALLIAEEYGIPNAGTALSVLELQGENDAQKAFLRPLQSAVSDIVKVQEDSKTLTGAFVRQHTDNAVGVNEEVVLFQDILSTDTAPAAELLAANIADLLSKGALSTEEAAAVTENQERLADYLDKGTFTPEQQKELQIMGAFYDGRFLAGLEGGIATGVEKFSELLEEPTPVNVETNLNFLRGLGNYQVDALSQYDKVAAFALRSLLDDAPEGLGAEATAQAYQSYVDAYNTGFPADKGAPDRSRYLENSAFTDLVKTTGKRRGYDKPRAISESARTTVQYLAPVPNEGGPDRLWWETTLDRAASLDLLPYTREDGTFVFINDSKDLRATYVSSGFTPEQVNKALNDSSTILNKYLAKVLRAEEANEDQPTDLYELAADLLENSNLVVSGTVAEDREGRRKQLRDAGNVGAATFRFDVENATPAGMPLIFRLQRGDRRAYREEQIGVVRWADIPQTWADRTGRVQLPAADFGNDIQAGGLGLR